MRTRLNHRAFLFAAMLQCCILACNKIPEGILSKEDMEEVLFDYHLTQGMIDQMNSEERMDNQRYLDAVFRKHNITEAEFDSSMVWYNRNGVLMKEIYANLNKRFKEFEGDLKLRHGNGNMLTSYTQDGDTANIWTGNPLIILHAKDRICKEVFTLKADSNFHRKDKYRLYATVAFIREIRDERECNLSVGLSIEYKDGKTVGTQRMVDYNGPLEVNVEAGNEADIEAVHGYFFYKGKKGIRNLAIINKIALLRMHDKSVPVTPAVTDTVAKDSVEADTVPKTLLPKKHLSPEEVREQNKTKERIEIKLAPDVRTKNSYGPRRKNAKKKSSSQ